MSKSHISMVTNFCPICGKEFQTSETLLDTRLLPTLNKTTCVAVELCPEHEAMVSSGEYRAFFAVEERQCTIQHCSNANRCHPPMRRKCDAQHYKQDGKFFRRTGKGFLMRTKTAQSIFSCPVAPVNHCSEALVQEMEKRIKKD